MDAKFNRSGLTSRDQGYYGLKIHLVSDFRGVRPIPRRSFDYKQQKLNIPL